MFQGSDIHGVLRKLGRVTSPRSSSSDGLFLPTVSLPSRGGVCRLWPSGESCSQPDFFQHANIGFYVCRWFKKMKRRIFGTCEN